MPRSDPMWPVSTRPIELRTDHIACTVLAGKGADIVSFVERRSGVDVMFRTPWAMRDPTLLPASGDTKVDWLARYPGGWQLLVPNAGDAREAHGVTLGFHGEAAVVPWRVDEADAAHAVLSTDLVTAPLHLARRVHVAGRTLVVRDELRNDSPDDVAVAWSEHVAFGPPFVGTGSRLSFDARRFVSDAEAPGTVLAPGVDSAVSQVVDRDGRPVDLTELPAPGERRELFGTLADFETGSCVVTSPSCGFAVELGWTADVLPYAWLWQELSATAGFPWFRRVHAVGVEPSNVPTTVDPSTGTRRDAPPVLAGGGSRRAELSLSVVELGDGHDRH